MGLVARMREDIAVVFERDPAARGLLEVCLSYAGLHALWGHRVAHALWSRRLVLVPRVLSQVVRLVTGVEIHPGARIGRRVFIDHGAGVVIGETAEVGDDCVLYQGVTLGGISLSKEKRHPTLGDHVVVGAGARVLGPIRIGCGARIGANSVAIRDVPEGATVVGIPAQEVIRRSAAEGSHITLHHERIASPVSRSLAELERRVEELESRLAERDPRREER